MEFFSTAERLWRTASEGDISGFDEVCASFKSSDIFEGREATTEKIKLFSGTQLAAFAEELRKTLPVGASTATAP